MAEPITRGDMEKAIEQLVKSDKMRLANIGVPWVEGCFMERVVQALRSLLLEPDRQAKAAQPDKYPSHRPKIDIPKEALDKFALCMGDLPLKCQKLVNENFWDLLTDRRDEWPFCDVCTKVIEAQGKRLVDRQDAPPEPGNWPYYCKKCRTDYRAPLAKDCPLCGGRVLLKGGRGQDARGEGEVISALRFCMGVIAAGEGSNEQKTQVLDGIESAIQRLQKQGPSVTREWVEAQAEKWHDCFGIRGYFDPMEKKQYISFFETMLTKAGIAVKDMEGKGGDLTDKKRSDKGCVKKPDPSL